MKTRFWEIDFIRGLAVFGMIFYHLLVDLKLFYSLNVPVFGGILLVFARLIASIFIFFVGAGVSFQWERHHSLSVFFKRSLVILTWAIIITITTYLLFPSEFIFFGVLHLIGTSLLLLIPFLFIKNNILILVLAFFIIITGISHRTQARPTLDYFPLFPWFGLVLAGLVFGRQYSSWRNKFNFQKPKTIFIKIIEKSGRNSLSLYLLHQPILIGLLFLLKSVLHVVY